MAFSISPLNSLGKADLQSLVDNQVAESKLIEYKESLSIDSDSAKKEFLADVSSFANASGGDLIFGIKEESGIATEVCGLPIVNADAEIIRLESIIRDGIEPRIPSISTHAVSLADGLVAIIIRIGKSWACPHMVTYKANSRFYSRNSAGKYPLDVTELRAAFVLSETTTDRIRNFRLDRLARVVSGETPVLLENNAKIILHIIPISAFDTSTKFDLTPIANDLTHLFPLYADNITGARYNLDGYLTYSHFPKSTSAYTYLQIFRNGCIEAVEAFLLHEEEGRRIIPSIAYERELINGLQRFSFIQKRLGVEPPFFIMLSLLGVIGYVMSESRPSFSMEPHYRIDRDALLLPEIFLEHSDDDPSQVMKPIFDAVWNSAGWQGSKNYDAKGKWTPNR